MNRQNSHPSPFLENSRCGVPRKCNILLHELIHEKGENAACWVFISNTKLLKKRKKEE
jgi:hypothetical protein